MPPPDDPLGLLEPPLDPPPEGEGGDGIPPPLGGIGILPPGTVTLVLHALANRAANARKITGMTQPGSSLDGSLCLIVLILSMLGLLKLLSN